MSKKQNFLRSEQSRDAHPKRDQVGSPARKAEGARAGPAAKDLQEAHTGKVVNDHNKQGKKGADADQPGTAHLGELPRSPDHGSGSAEPGLRTQGRRRGGAHAARGWLAGAVNGAGLSPA
jgi:hypothetical protein